MSKSILFLRRFHQGCGSPLQWSSVQRIKTPDGRENFNVLKKMTVYKHRNRVKTTDYKYCIKSKNVLIRINKTKSLKFNVNQKSFSVATRGQDSYPDTVFVLSGKLLLTFS